MKISQVGKLVSVILCSGVFCVPARAALVPPAFIDSVAALGALLPQPGGQPGRLDWQATGTGFFYSFLAKDDPDPAQRRYEVYLVTAKHVVQPYISANLDINVRLNPKAADGPSREFPIANHPQPGAGTWFCHPDPSVDVGIVQINLDFLKAEGTEPSVFIPEQHAANRKVLTQLGVAAGDGVFVLGFPMGWSGAQRNYVIVRQGIIARLSEMLDHASPTFLVDAFVSPGNSGGPVILKPDVTSIIGTKSQSTAYVIGLVTSYRPYTDTAVSQGRLNNQVQHLSGRVLRWEPTTSI